MVVIRPPVWISILFTFIGIFLFLWDLRVHAAEILACYGIDDTCAFFSMQCPNDHRINVERLQYGLTVGAGMSCQNDLRLNCTHQENICCDKGSDKCIVDFPEHEAESVRKNCSGKPSCGPIRANHTQFYTPSNCIGKTSDYAIVNYSCGPGPSTTTPRPVTTASNIVTSTSTLSTRVSSPEQQTNPGLTSTSLNGTSTTAWQTRTSATTSNVIPTSDKYSSTALTSASFNDGEEHPERIIIIMVVVVAVLVLSAILAIVFILHRRRCKKSSQEDTPKNQLPDVLINYSNMNFGGTDQDYKTVESSNYDEMNDESIATYSRPVKKNKDGSTIAIDEKKTGGNGATDEYDRIEFAKKYPVKMTNYDSVSATEVQKVDDTYSHVSSQWKPASAAATNDYSRCQVIRHESKSNDDTNKTGVSNEPLFADNYSHVDLNAEKTKIRPSNIIEEDSYNPNELDKTTNPPRNGHAVSVRTIAKYEEGSQTFKDLQSLGAESEGWPICDRNYGVSSQDQPLQDIKAISLPDKYIEFKIGDIYDTPRCKDQQYNVVLKGNKEQLLNRIETGSKRKSETEDNNGVIEDCAVRSDYELAKPIDF